ncbi:SpoIIE family protein phosphatase [Kitasatospora sp. NPDC004745]|uniref:SpoIIE family protein phosphatase n=1 Tax=Kitasatospora sp. NPDC004745 TaxID=3364019 RepID=UPI0036A51CE6
MSPGPDPEDGTARALAGTVRRLQRTVERMRAEDRSRAVVDLATGILSERLGLSLGEAAAHLGCLARESGVPVAALAADVAGLPAPEHPGEADGEPVAAPGPAAFAGGERSELQHAVEAVLDQTGGPLGVRAVAVWQCLADGALALAAQAGLPTAEAAAWARVPPGVPTPAQRAVGLGRDLWPGTPETAGPSVGPGSVRAVLPLLERGRRRGALEVLWPPPAPGLGSAERRQLRALADLCATLLDGPAEPPADDDLGAVPDGLLTPALLLAPVLRGGRVADFAILRVNDLFHDPLGRPRAEVEGSSLLEAYPVAAATGLFAHLLRCHESGAAQPAALLELEFQRGANPLPSTVRLAVAPLGDRLLLSWQPGPARAGAPQQADLLRQAQRLARVAGFEEPAGTGRIGWSEGLHELFGLPPEAAPVPLAHLGRHAHPDDEPAIRRLVDTVRHRHRSASAVFRLVRPDGAQRYTRVIAEPVLDAGGRLAAVRGAYHDVSAQHWTEVALGATRERLADSEQESAERAELALRLQQAILPTVPPALGPGGLRAAVRYRPAAKKDRVGGDWYDVMPLPDGRVLLAVGDVAGHGVGAATGMVALRHALRALAVTGAGPGRMLEWANTVALGEPGQVTATAVCVLLDPAGGGLHWARAGHLPPIRLGAAGAEVLPLPHGVLLGALEDAAYEEHTARLDPGDVLLLYTDGLVERRDRPVEESVDQLIRAAGAPGPDLEGFLDRLLELSPSDTDDDTCLVAVRRD